MGNFNAAPNKKAKISLETTAFKQSRSDLNVAFSTADRETAIFEFTVTQNKQPLLLGNNNIKSSIVFVHSKGLKIRLPLEITDGMNGKISIQIPDDIIKLPGKVTAQVYVARKSIDETYAVVAERIFSFVIEESLAWEFDSETKLNYIVEFDELEEQLKQRAYDIEQAMANAEDYVAKIEQAKDIGLSDIEIAKTNSLDELNTLATTKLNEINATGTQYVNDLTEVRNGIDGKIQQFNNDVDAGDYVKGTDTVKWQKQNITDEQGYSISIETIDFMNIKETITTSGLYYVINSTNGPIDENNTGYIYANFKNVDNGLLEFVPLESNNKYYVQKINGMWGSILNPNEYMETTMGSQLKTDKSLKDAKDYTNEQLNLRFKSLWKGSANNKGTTLNLSEEIKNFQFLVLISSSVGGTKNEWRYIDNVGWMVIQDFNLADVDGSSARMSECVIDVIDDLQLKIRHNHSFIPGTNTALIDANTISLKEIVGVR